MRAEITALPTYGYRRAGALVNRTRALMGLQAINHKRFYRVMKEHSLLLSPRQQPRAGEPASARFRMAMIWLSVNRDVFIAELSKNQLRKFYF